MRRLLPLQREAFSKNTPGRTIVVDGLDRQMDGERKDPTPARSACRLSDLAEVRIGKQEGGWSCQTPAITLVFVLVTLLSTYFSLALFLCSLESLYSIFTLSPLTLNLELDSKVQASRG